MGITRAFVYGDLLIETMAVVKGEIRFGELHFARITRSAVLLGFKMPDNWNYEYFKQLVVVQCPETNMRARLIMYRTGSGFYLSNTNEIAFDVNYWPMPEQKTSINEVGIYPNEFKSCTPLSNLKSGNALIHVMAAQYALSNKLDDALILNTNGNIAEATASNVFWVKNGIIYTPALSEAPVAGIMREVLLTHLGKQGLSVNQSILNEETLLNADEVFLTNALHPVVSVQRYSSVQFKHELTDIIRKEFLERVF